MRDFLVIAAVVLAFAVAFLALNWILEKVYARRMK